MGDLLGVEKWYDQLITDIDEAMSHILKYIQTNYKVVPRKRMWWLFEKR